MWYNYRVLLKEWYKNDLICPCIYIKTFKNDFVIIIVYVLKHRWNS